MGAAAAYLIHPKANVPPNSAVVGAGAENHRLMHGRNTPRAECRRGHPRPHKPMHLSLADKPCFAEFLQGWERGGAGRLYAGADE